MCSNQQSSFDEINDRVVKPERGELVRGSDPPLVCSARTTAEDMWRAPTRLPLNVCLAAGLWDTETKSLGRPPTANNGILSRLGGRPQDNAGNLSCPRAWIHKNSSALSPTSMWPCAERRGFAVDCLDLDIGRQSLLLGNVDGGLINQLQVGPLDQK